LADSDEAIRLDPKYARAYEARSATYAALGDQEKCDRDAAKAQELAK
jgi:Flp pilus assembly protein TadD